MYFKKLFYLVFLEAYNENRIGKSNKNRTASAF